jgi:transglutaminase-like putative cysteine protease
MERIGAGWARFVPPEGWLAVGLVYLIGLTAAWAIDDARWFLNDPIIADFLATAVIGGITVSLIAARVGWGRWTGHLIGAIFAALIVPLWVGERFLPDGAAAWELYTGAASSVVDTSFEVLARGRVLYTGFGPTLLLLGFLVWGTGMFAATAVFRHHRPLAAITAFGILLLVNVSLTIEDQLGYLVLFSASSLLLLVRLHALDEQTSWLRARLGDPRPVRRHTVRAGSAFVLAAVVGAFALTQTASSAPLRNAWPEDLEDGIVDVGQELADFFPFVSAIKGPSGQDFSVNPRISGLWESKGQLAFTATLPPNAPRDLYWRAATFDTFDGVSLWSPSNQSAFRVAAGNRVLEAIGDPTVAGSRVDLTATITPGDTDNDVAVVPGLPISFDQDTDVYIGAPTESLVRVFLTNEHLPYQVTGSRIKPWTSQDPTGLSANQLLVSGRSYPTSIRRQYMTKVDVSVIGPESRAFLAGVTAAAGDAPYAIAAEMQRRLRGFTYDPDVRNVACPNVSLVECFMQTKRGYCMHSATAMAVLLREAGIPSRLVMGYLPGTRSGSTETVTDEQSHAWVEVYFLGWGWVPFDPTAEVSQIQALPAGPVVATPSPGASVSLPPEDVKDPERRGGTPEFVPGSTSALGIGTIALTAVGILVLALLTLLAVVWVRGVRRGDTGVADAYRRVVGLASRLGYGPRPSQTIYEYAESLGRLVPVARADLMTVAEARVETAYGHHELGTDRLAAVTDAARRLRVSLLRLFFRRGGRGRPRRPSRR